MRDDIHPTLLHLHIFKNAGTSVDNIFKEYFSERYFSFDLPHSGKRIDVKKVNDFFAENPSCRYLTSHQIGMPAPVYLKRPIFPIFMLREPFGRVPSCFFFERDKQRRVAADETIETYVRRHLDSGAVTATIGLQLLTLTDHRLIESHRRTALDADALASAERTVEGAAAFGIVERFEDSMRLLIRSHARWFPGLEALLARIDTRANIGPSPPEARSEARRYLRETLSRETFAELEEALAPEVRLYETGLRVFEARLAHAALEPSQPDA